MRHFMRSFISMLTLSIFLSVGVAYAVPIELLPNGTFATGDTNGGTVQDGGLAGWSAWGKHPVKVITGDAYTSPRPGSGDTYYVRAGTPGVEGGTQVIGEGTMVSDLFTIPWDTATTDVSFWWRFFTYDSSSFDISWVVVKASDGTAVDRPCGTLGGVSEGGLEDTGWLNCSKTYDAATLLPGEDYFLRFTLLTTFDNTLPSWSYLDDVSVAAQPIPEPATLLLMGAGLLGMPLISNRLRKKIRRSGK